MQMSSLRRRRRVAAAIFQKEDEEDHAYFHSESDGEHNGILLEGSSRKEEILAWTGRIAGILSFLGALYIFYRAWHRRDHAHHRLMLAISVYLLLWSPWMVYGVAGLPKDSGVTGASGTVATCTAQGVFNQLVATAVPAYFVALGVLQAWGILGVATRSTSGKPSHPGDSYQTYGARVEAHIHFWINLWAIASVAYLASVEAFNPSEGWCTSCWIGAVPEGCGQASGIPCERGPPNLARVLAVFTGLPVVLLLVLPTLAVIGLACWSRVRRCSATRTTTTTPPSEKQDPQPSTESSSGEDSEQEQTETAEQKPRRSTDNSSSNHNEPCPDVLRDATRQSMIYLGALYWIYTPGLLVSSLFVLGDEKYKRFAVEWLGNAITLSMGLWYALVYRYLSPRSLSLDETLIQQRRRSSKRLDGTKGVSATTGISRASSLRMSWALASLRGRELPADDNTSTQKTQDELPTKHPSSSDKPNKLSDSGNASSSFCIFDGSRDTLSNSVFSQFIFEGDSEDEEEDLEETRYWADCQNLNSSHVENQ